MTCSRCVIGRMLLSLDELAKLLVWRLLWLREWVRGGVGGATCHIHRRSAIEVCHNKPFIEIRLIFLCLKGSVIISSTRFQIHVLLQNHVWLKSFSCSLFLLSSFIRNQMTSQQQASDYHLNIGNVDAFREPGPVTAPPINSQMFSARPCSPRSAANQ